MVALSRVTFVIVPYWKMVALFGITLARVLLENGCFVWDNIGQSFIGKWSLCLG